MKYKDRRFLGIAIAYFFLVLAVIAMNYVIDYLVEKKKSDLKDICGSYELQ
jgi:hypothetical protein